MAIRTIQIERRTQLSAEARIGRRREVVIPKHIADELRLAVGDAVEVGRRGSSVVITPRSSVNPDDVLSPHEAKLARKGMRDVAAGRVIDWADYKKTHFVDRKPR